jgi:hypothetical protein
MEDSLPADLPWEKCSKKYFRKKENLCRSETQQRKSVEKE